MVDLASDHDTAIELIIDEYHRLQKHNPNHELLQYITDVNEDGFENVNSKYEEFLDKFESSEDKKLPNIKVAKVLTSYYVALRDAVDKIEGINRSPKINVPIKTIENKLSPAEDLPF
jgi:hypothetical protein